jgi:tRNA threonylcarbamoyladenosine biosynthesis protein TsaE
MKCGSLIYTSDELEVPVKLLHQYLGMVNVIAFSGILGAGKTTLIQALLQYCGVEGFVQSPTFTYMSYYTGHDGRRFYHFDLYRMHALETFVREGFAEYLHEPNSVSLIEWPEIIMPLLKKEVCFVSLTYVNETSRNMRYEAVMQHKVLL